MFEASLFLAQKWAGVKPANIVSAAPISHLDATSLSLKLNADGIRCLYSSFVSVADALRGIEGGFYSWSGVKLYYSVFYALRASLAFSGTAIFYLDRSPLWIEIRPGATPQRGTGTTHKFVMSLFSQKESNSTLLSQPIDSVSALSWLQERREEFNYTNAKFCEPTCPTCFRHLPTSGVRRLVGAYLADQSFSYAFDPEHAMLAYPIEVLKFVITQKAPNDAFEDSDRTILRSILADKLGPLSFFEDLIRH